MRVIDSHVHFPEDHLIDDGRPSRASATDGSASGTGYSSGPSVDRKAHPWIEAEKVRWAAAWRNPAPRKVSWPEGERLWRAEVEAREYLKSVVFVTTGSNDDASGLIARNPGIFLGYAHHDPLLPDAAERLERALGPQAQGPQVLGGLCGYKILGPAIDRRLDDPSFYPLWEIAQAHEVPVLIHFGIMGGAGGIANHVNINPIIIHDVAKRFPHLPIIIPHFGCGYVFETLNLCWACPNVFVDTSGSNQWMRWMPYPIDLASLFRKYRETVGPSRIIFGTDSSWFPRGFAEAYLDDQVREMYDNGYSADEVDAVLYRNIAALLKVK
ncbi:MAG: amidohydrolase family protein [Rectinemataceae bacterium]